MEISLPYQGLEMLSEALKAHQEEIIEQLIPGHKAILDAITPALKMMPSANEMRVAMASVELLRSLPPGWLAQQTQIIESWRELAMTLPSIQQMTDAWGPFISSSDILANFDASFVRLAYEFSTLLAGLLPLDFPPVAFPGLVVDFTQAETEDDQRAVLRATGLPVETIEVCIAWRKRYRSPGYNPERDS